MFCKVLVGYGMEVSEIEARKGGEATEVKRYLIDIRKCDSCRTSGLATNTYNCWDSNANIDSR